MASFFLIRHAEPEVTGVMLGQMDPHLSARGRLQAAALAGLPVELAWCSPLHRARETADLLGCPVIEIPELREIDQGEWTGKTWAEVEAESPNYAARKCADWLGVPAPGGETWAALLTRVQSALERIRLGPTPAAIVAHQGVNAALLQLIEGRDPITFAQEYGEMMRIDVD